MRVDLLARNCRGEGLGWAALVCKQCQQAATRVGQTGQVQSRTTRSRTGWAPVSGPLGSPCVQQEGIRCFVFSE